MDEGAPAEGAPPPGGARETADAEIAATEAEAHRAAERERRFFLALGALVRDLARAALAPSLLLGVYLLAAWLYRLPRAVAETPELLLLIPLGLRLTGGLARGLFARERRLGAPEDRRSARLVPVDDATARHLRRSIRVLGGLVSVLAPLAGVLEANRYPRGAIDAVWLALELLALLALVVTLSRRGLFAAVAPRAETRVGQAAARALKALYPFFAVYLLAILAVHGIGYVNLARFLARVTALSAAVLGGAYVVWKFAAYRLDVWIERQAVAVRESVRADEAPGELMYRRSLHDAVDALARLALVGATGYLLLFAWGLDVAAARDLVFNTWIPGLHWDTGTDAGEVGLAPSELYEVALLTLLTWYGARIARQLARRRLRASSSFDRGTQDALANAVFVVTAGVGGYAVLGKLHANLEALKWLGGAIGLGVGFGLQNIVNNFVSGLILLIERPVRTDDIVELEGGIAGRVEQIGTRSTVVIDLDNIARIVPNSDLIQKNVTNWTHNDPLRRVNVRVGVKYGSDVHAVRHLMVEVAHAHGLVLKTPPPEVFFDDFGEKALFFTLCCYIDLAGDLHRERRVRSDLRAAVDAAFRRKGSEIQFP